MRVTEFELGTGDLVESEKIRKSKLLLLFAKIMAVFVFFGLLTTLINMFITHTIEYATLIGLSSVFLFYYLSFKLATTKYYRLACWLLIIPSETELVLTSLQFGTELPLFIAFLVPIGIASVLLETVETALLVGFSSLYLGGLYVIQNMLNWFTPFGNTSASSIASTGLIMSVLGIPLVAALMVFPSQGQARALKQQNLKLIEALSKLKERQNLSREVSTEVQELVAELRATSNQQADGSQQQAAAVQQINASVGMLSDTAVNIEELAGKVSNFANLMAQNSERIETTTTLSVEQSKEGIVSVQHTIEVSQEVGKLYQNLLTTLQDLNAKGANMRRILELLDTISDETHLLSLNAAIEAAGAGVYGERFNVVAQEVKNLAARSSKANQEVILIVSEIENASVNAVKLVDAGARKAKEMETVAGKAGQVIDGMGRISEEAQEQANAINTVTQDVVQLGEIIKQATFAQKSSSQQVLNALNGLSLVAQESLEGSNQVSMTAWSLEELIEKLNASLIISN